MSQKRHFHFVGLCGTGMASVAVELKNRGHKVTGSDRDAYPPMSTFLEENDIPLSLGFSENNLNPKPDMVVIGNSISRGNPEAELVFEKRLEFTSLAGLLSNEFLVSKKCLVVTGTHGKTTTTSLLAWILEKAGLNPGFFIGGIPANFGKGARFTDSEYFVLEGDEYDTAFFDKRSKFIHYRPDIGIINNLEFDHADIFENLDAVKKTFKHFINLIPRNGLLLANGDDENIKSITDIDFCPVRYFGTSKDNEYTIDKMQESIGRSQFDLGGIGFSIPLSGEFNMRNASAAILAARQCGVRDTDIQSALDTFSGVKRRMSVFGEAGGVTIIDDFAHHPTAIAQTLSTLKKLYPDRRIVACFEPRSNTTRRNFFQESLPVALGVADLVYIAEIARKDQLDPSERLNEKQVIIDLNNLGKDAGFFPTPNDIINHYLTRKSDGDIVVILSNGGFGGIHGALLDALSQ